MKKTKRIWAMILAVVIVLGMTPFVSVAETVRISRTFLRGQFL